MAYLLRYTDGSAQVLSGRVAITRQDNDLTKPDTVQAAFSTSFALPDDVATHKRLALPQLGTSLSPAPYAGSAVCLEAGGVEVLPGAQLRLDDYTPRTGYTSRLLAGNKSFYDLLGDKTLRQLDLSAFDHDWTLAQVAAGAAHSAWQQGYVYDLYDRGQGAPPLPAAGSSRLFEAGYWPTAYARAVWEAIFQGAGVKWRGELPAIFDTALLPATAPFGYSDPTRAAYQAVVGYAATDGTRHFEDEQDDLLPYQQTSPTKADRALRLGSAAVWDPIRRAVIIQQTGYYDLKAEQDMHLYCNSYLNGTVSATVQVFVNGQFVGFEDQARGSGSQDASLAALAERQLLHAGDVVQGRFKFDAWGSGPFNTGPFDESWELMPRGRLSVELLADFPPGGRVHLADWLPDMLQKDFVKAFIQAYGLTQTTDPYTGAVSFRRTAGVLDNPLATAQDWSERLDGSQPAKRSWKLGDFASRNWFRWKEDGSNPAYAQAKWEQAHTGLGWNDDAAQAAAMAFGAGYLDNGAGDTSLDATKDVLTMPFAASPVGEADLLLLPYWKPKQGTDYQADLVVIQEAQNDGTYSAEEAQAARAKALVDDFDTQAPVARLCYQLPASYTRAVLLDDGQGSTQTVTMATSYFVMPSQEQDLDFRRCLLPAYYPHLAAALLRPLVLRPSVRLSAAEVVRFDQLVPVWLAQEGAYFWVNKVDNWEEDAASTAVELIRL
jgi:hypothetical protein